MIRSIVEKGRNFARPFYITKADIVCAFDNVRHSTPNAALKLKGVKPFVRLPLVRQNMDEYCQLRLQDVRTQPVKRVGGVKQGGPSSMGQFGCAFAYCVDNIIDDWNHHDWGFEYGPNCFVNNVQIADDFYVVSGSWHQFQQQCCQLKGALDTIGGMNMSHRKFQWISNVDSSQMKVLIMRCGQFQIDDSIDSLGCTVSVTASFWLEVDRRIAKGWRTFWSIAELLKNKQACIKGRLKLAAVTIRRSMLWGMESATLLLQDIKRLNFAWIDMVSKMLAIVRQDGEPWLDWYIRSLRHAKGVLHYTGIKSLAHFKEPDASKG